MAPTDAGLRCLSRERHERQACPPEVGKDSLAALNVFMMCLNAPLTGCLVPGDAPISLTSALAGDQQGSSTMHSPAVERRGACMVLSAACRHARKTVRGIFC